MGNKTPDIHVGPKGLRDPNLKHAEADKLRADVEAFQANGGKIEVLGNTPLKFGVDESKQRKNRKGGRRKKAVAADKDKPGAFDSFFPKRLDALDLDEMESLSDVDANEPAPETEVEL